jgi:hypothetical protein
MLWAIMSDPPLRSPLELLRKRRPEQFTDSTMEQVVEFTPDHLGFVLANITVQRREAAFENFSRFLCQREVCPNILPQTGPVGGGDSKTDGSTYPVAPSLAAEWPWYLSRAAASELWAFAFSAKEDWRAKVRDDVSKIAGLPTRPTKAFFVTSQPVKDKARAEVIEQVRSEWSLDLTILDRTWIVERTFKGHHEDLVSDALGVAVPVRAQRSLGPLDSKRQAELDTLEKRLQAPGATAHPTAALVEEYLLGARLCRGLGLPEDRALGFLQRAQQAAAESGARPLVIDALYQTGWTLFWWYEDIVAVDRIYDALEKEVLETTEPWFYELLGNLWMNLYGQCARSDSDASAVERLATRRHRIDERLRSIEADPARPNGALYAKLLRQTAGLTLALSTPDRLPALLEELGESIRAAEHAPLVPLMSTLDVIEEFGRVVPPIPEYEVLYKLTCEIRERHDGELAAGASFLRRGATLLSAGRPSEALTYLTQARERLAKYEALDGLRRTRSLSPKHSFRERAPS